jgi:alpha-tubulin suppressor-like RCC1 family protein
VPIDVTGLSSGIRVVSAGGEHTCALNEAGGVVCWGYNGSGALGDNGDCGLICSPVGVSGLSSGVSALSSGYRHTCVLTASGGVKCWGYNFWGQIGDNTTTDRDAPVDVTGLASGVTAVVSGQYHSCALTTGGGVKCWGYGGLGQLGNSSFLNQLTPVDVSGLSSGVTAITGGWNHTCALLANGSVKCWGFNPHGELGNGGTANSSSPVDVVGLPPASAVSGGRYHTCALSTSGGVWCWGANAWGQLGDGTTTGSTTPTDVTGLDFDVGAVSAGGLQTCAVTNAGTVKCWGDNAWGQLGDGTTDGRTTPVDVSGKGSVDSDGDGCPDDREVQAAPGSETSGGLRNPKNPFDYFNPTADGENRIDDVLMVIGKYYVDFGQVGYTYSTDRTALGPNQWNVGPPNLAHRVDDVLAIIYQYFHDCS